MTQQQETVTKQKNPLRIEQGKKLVEYNKRKKEELKRLNEQITKQDNMADHKPKSNMNNYVYAGGLSVLRLAISGYLLYSKFKKQKRNLIDVPRPPVLLSSCPPVPDDVCYGQTGTRPLIVQFAQIALICLLHSSRKECLCGAYENESRPIIA